MILPGKTASPTAFPPEKSGAHPNTAVLRLTDASGHTVRVEGASIGGGNIVIRELNGFRLDLSGALPSIIVAHLDRPGVIAGITRLIAEAGGNIASIRDIREKRGQTALMVIETDEELSPYTSRGLPPAATFSRLSPFQNYELSRKNRRKHKCMIFQPSLN